MKIQENSTMVEKLEVTNYAKEQGGIGMEYKVNRINEVSDKISEISHGKRKDINIIEEISRTHIYNTDVALKNLDIGRNGILNKQDANLYHKDYGGFNESGPKTISSHIINIKIIIDMKTLIIDGYRGRDYPKNEEVTKSLANNIAKKYCEGNFGCSYEITDKRIEIIISELEQSYPIFNFKDYGEKMEGYINSTHQFMEAANINRADMKFEFNNAILITPKL